MQILSEITHIFFTKAIPKVVGVWEIYCIVGLLRQISNDLNISLTRLKKVMYEKNTVAYTQFLCDNIQFFS